MNTNGNFTTDEILYLDPKILAEALNLLQQLVAWVDNDVFTDAPERAESVAGAEETLQLSHQVMRMIEKALEEKAIVDGNIIQSRLAPDLALVVPADGDQVSSENLANRILDEAEEAFGTRSLARERAACGNWESPVTVADYLLWVEDEAALQEELGEDLIYAKALRGIANEIRELGFEASPPPWEKVTVNENPFSAMN
jgi:hypothetical protein